MLCFIDNVFIWLGENGCCLFLGLVWKVYEKVVFEMNRVGRGGEGGVERVFYVFYVELSLFFVLLLFLGFEIIFRLLDLLIIVVIW